MLKIRLETLTAALMMLVGLAFVGTTTMTMGCSHADDDDDTSDDDDTTPADDDDDDDDDDATDDDDAAPSGLETCDEDGGNTLPQDGTLTCGGDDGLEWDWYTVDVEAGDCVYIYADNDAGAADLLALAVDSDLETSYGLVDDYSQLDDEAPCSVDTWNGFACPAASVTAVNDGAFRIAIGQWGGDGCTEGAGYSISFAVNGADLQAAQTHDNASLDAFFADPGTPGDDDDSSGDDDDDDSADDDDDSSHGDDDDSAGDDDDSAAE